NITQPNSGPLTSNPNIYIMDIRNYTWINSFETTSVKEKANSDPSTTQSPTTTSIIVFSNNSNNELVTMKIIIASIGGTVGAVIIMVFGFLLYRWNRNRNEQSPKYINQEHNLPGSIVAY
ncbi:10725_t:CDS:1, partial [Funneliformis mosseae]